MNAPATPNRAWRFAVDRWATVDTRTLGLFRIYFGLLLLGNLWDRVGGENLVNFYSNEGLLPNHYALFRPPADGFWSLMLGFSSPNETLVCVVFIALVYGLYTVGWQTRWMQVLALLCYESLNLRFLIIQHGGNVVMNIVLVWTCFLPVGDRFSVDSVLRSLRATKDETVEALNARGWLGTARTHHVGLAFAGICFNFAAIYFFNTIHKSGPGWLDGTAVHYMLWQNRMSTMLCDFIRNHEPFWLSPMLTWGTLLMEGGLVLMILSPWKQRPLRTLAFAVVWALHGGIAALNTLGPFSYAMMGFGLLLIQGADFDFLSKRFTRDARRRTVRLSFEQPLHRLAARVLARLDLLGHLTFEQGAKLEVRTPDGKALTSLAAIAEALRALPLGSLWSLPFRVLFLADLGKAVLKTAARWYLELGPRPALSPEGPLHRRLRLTVQLVLPALIWAAVISQLLKENAAMPPAVKAFAARRPQLLTNIIEYGQIPQGWHMFAPDVPRDDIRLVIDATLADGTHLDLLEEKPPDFEIQKRGPYYMSQHWCEIHARLRRLPEHWRNFRDFLYRIPAKRGWGPEKQVVAVEVWQVMGMVPRPGSTEWGEITRLKLFDQNL